MKAAASQSLKGSELETKQAAHVDVLIADFLGAFLCWNGLVSNPKHLVP